MRQSQGEVACLGGLEVENRHGRQDMSSLSRAINFHSEAIGVEKSGVFELSHISNPIKWSDVAVRLSVLEADDQRYFLLVTMSCYYTFINTLYHKLKRHETRWADAHANRTPSEPHRCLLCPDSFFHFYR